ncbi:DNA mismatch repair protein MutT [Solibacillus sp. R5-41]|uniref:NUDIX hydrolase n=1 Tax=Solibacillus sp. R5-41 TaxID=2048654 RepID=UPI000C124DF8|nr:NUDIX domain-containing protein [Solibacillus sp. R5-41]ATP41992.1 DNA mismatch repair protein MutT [Solibacillus sp. R5-41]
MAEIKVAIKGVLIKNNKMLIVKRSAFDETGAGTWESVGGVLQFGESFEVALKREFLEEAGLNISVSTHLFSTTFLTKKTRQIVLLTFLCECQNDEISLSDEHEQFMWATKSELMELLPEEIINDYKVHNVFKLL